MKIEDPELQLVEAVAAYDEVALVQFLKRYDGLIRASALQGSYYFADARDEEEIQNDVRHEVVKSIKAWDRTKGRFSTWVYAVARNVVNGFLRDRERGLATGRYGIEVSLETRVVSPETGCSEQDAGEDVVQVIHEGATTEPNVEGYTSPLASVATAFVTATFDRAEDDGGADMQLPPLLRAFHAFADTLEPNERTLLEHILSGDPHRVLAERLNITEGNAKVRVSRLKKRAKLEIAKLVGHP